MRLNKLFEGSNNVYYHGTNREFGKFEVGADKANRATNITGVYFTPHQWEAEEYGQRVIQARLHYKKLFDVQKWNDFNLAMKNKALELLAKHTTYREEWLKKAIIPDMVDKGRFTGGLMDVSGDIKREILLAGGYDAIKDGDHIAMLTTDGIEVVENVEEDCWKGYKQVGMKKKGKKQVPNCIPESNDGTQEEVFHFGNKTWDVQRGYQLVKQHNIQPEMLPVQNGLAKFLGFTRTNQDWAKDAHLEDPVLLIDTGNGVMVIDGYHRILRAKNEGIEELPGYILSKEMSDEIEI